MEANEGQTVEENEVAATENIETDTSENLIEEAPEVVAPQPEYTEESGQTVGPFLREARDAQNLTLKVVSKYTKISNTNLEFLENDLLERLPDKAYVAGYVKSYRKILGVDQKESLDRLEFTYNLKSPPQPTFEETVKTSNKEVVQKDLMVKIAAGVVAVFAIVAVVTLFNSKKEEVETKEKQVSTPATVTPKKVTADTPLQTDLQIEKSTESAEVKAEEAQTKTEEIKKPVPAVAVADVKPVEPVKKEEPKKVVEEVKEKKAEKKETKEDEKERKFANDFSPSYTFDSDYSQEKIEENLPTQFKNSVIKGKQNVYIRAINGDTWLTYKADDKDIKKFVLKQDKGILIRGEEVRLFLGNINVVKIFLNNQPLMIRSRTGVKSLVFPQENRSKYMMPLFIYNKDGTVETSSDYIKRTEDEAESLRRPIELLEEAGTDENSN